MISESCHVEYINVSDLEKLKENFLDLCDCMKILKQRIKFNKVDDLDYFNFPEYKKQDYYENKDYN